MKKVVCCIFSHEITKGMKSFGSIGLLKASKKSTELILCNISNIKKNIKNIFLVLGFDEEKILDKLNQHNLTGKLEYVINTQYATTNQAYAFKLAINAILDKYQNDLEGILFINNNNLLKNMPQFPKKKSWVLIDKKSNKQRYSIGCFVENKVLKHMFYDLGDTSWTEIVYFCVSDIKKIQKEFDNLYYDNMFLFEVINKAIEEQDICLESLQLDRACDLIKINGIKDKSKIK